MPLVQLLKNEEFKGNYAKIRAEKNKITELKLKKIDKKLGMRVKAKLALLSKVNKDSLE